MNDGCVGGSERIPPLNLTKREATYLWTMICEEIGKEEVWKRGDNELVSSLHTKIGEISGAFDTDNEQSGGSQ